MSLTRPRRLTSSALVARRANALKSTGPRTVRGKARAGFNALKQGLHAARSARLRDRMIRAGYDRQEALYGHIRTRIARAFGASTPERRGWCDGLATQVWCLAVRPRAHSLSTRTKLKSHRKQMGWTLRMSSHQQIEEAVHSDSPTPDPRTPGGRPECVPLSFGISDPWNRIGLRFWVQRKRYWTLARMRRIVSSSLLKDELRPASVHSFDPAEDPPLLEKLAESRPGPPGPNAGLEGAVLSRTFRLAKPGAIERYRYGLMPNGDPDWEREPWKSALDRRRAAEVKNGRGEGTPGLPVPPRDRS